MRKKNSKNSKMKNTHSANNDMRQRKYFRARKKHSRHARSEISHTEKELRFTRCQKAQDIADNTLSATTSNILTHTNHIAPGDA